MSSWTRTDHITNHLGKKRLGDQRPPSLWPSDASIVLKNDHGESHTSGSCRRATFLRFIKSSYYYSDEFDDLEELVEKIEQSELPPERYMRFIWEAGNLYEDFVIEMAKQSGVWLASQVQIVIPAYNIVGKLDLLVKNPENGKVLAQEIKSIYGYNANEILGSPGMRNKRQLGKPRDSNLMQIAIYDWHLKNRIQDFQASRLLYGARDTGRDCEFEVTTFIDDDGITKIRYQGVAPFLTAPVVSDITIDGILANYIYVREHIEKKMIPPRDYNLKFSEERVAELFERGDLSMTNTKAYQKILDRQEENAKRIAEGKAKKKELKALELGDWLCGNCSYKNFCYDKNGDPINYDPKQKIKLDLTNF